MSARCFSFLTDCLRFDNPETRVERIERDKLAPIRWLWDNFIECCGRMYVPGENLTIDEQLLAFQGRVGFKIYKPSKPTKYEMKIVLYCDNKTKYMLGGMVYLGRQDRPPQ